MDCKILPFRWLGTANSGRGILEDSAVSPQWLHVAWLIQEPEAMPLITQAT